MAKQLIINQTLNECRAALIENGEILDFLIGVRVSAEVEDAGLDISEHAERAYADEEEFKLDMDTYVDDLEDKKEFFFNKKKSK